MRSNIFLPNILITTLRILKGILEIGIESVKGLELLCNRKRKGCKQLNEFSYHFARSQCKDEGDSDFIMPALQIRIIK